VNAKINYYWRLLATGACFAVFGVGALIMAVIIFPVVSLLARKKQSKVCKMGHSQRVCWVSLVDASQRRFKV
jgi:hypothetical protein